MINSYTSKVKDYSEKADRYINNCSKEIHTIQNVRSRVVEYIKLVKEEYDCIISIYGMVYKNNINYIKEVKNGKYF